MKEKLLKIYGWEPADGDYHVAKERRKQISKNETINGYKANKTLKHFIINKLSVQFKNLIQLRFNL